MDQKKRDTLPVPGQASFALSHLTCRRGCSHTFTAADVVTVGVTTASVSGRSCLLLECVCPVCGDEERCVFNTMPMTIGGLADLLASVPVEGTKDAGGSRGKITEGEQRRAVAALNDCETFDDLLKLIGADSAHGGTDVGTDGDDDDGGKPRDAASQ